MSTVGLILTFPFGTISNYDSSLANYCPFEISGLENLNQISRETTFDPSIVLPAKHPLFQPKVWDLSLLGTQVTISDIGSLAIPETTVYVKTIVAYRATITLIAGAKNNVRLLPREIHQPL